MVDLTRRAAFGAALLGAGAAAGTADAQGGKASGVLGGIACPAPHLETWGKTYEGQRKADLGNGMFLNPVLAGDHPDPTIMKDGEDYYMTFSSFDSVPGVVIWHSRDLVNWTPITAALTKNIGSVWAIDLLKHNGRFYAYIPARFPDYRSTYVIWADDIRGPWSEPVDLKLPRHIDPGHAVGEDGSRWLFLSGGDRVRLSDDGLSTVGEVEHVYDPWRYPEEWDVEGFAPEGPKITRHGDYFYLITAVGGTAGPPTGHMVIVARSKSINGPWEDCPHNPIVRTQSSSEKWWSRGHATLVEAPDGQWWMVYHGYENGFWTLGRQTLLDPIEWTADGWFRAKGGDLSKPLKKPRLKSPGKPVQHGVPLSDDFTKPRFGTQWSFFNPSKDEMSRVRVGGGVMTLKGAGVSPKDSSPLTFIVGDQAYEIEVDVELSPGAVGGVILFYDQQLYCGLGFNEKAFVTHQYGIERGRPANPHGRRMRMRMKNDRHIVTFHTSTDGQTWKKFDRQMEISGYHHNVRGGFLMLRPGVYAAGDGEVKFRDLKYRALD
jgi:beta-xylosidase